MNGAGQEFMRTAACFDIDGTLMPAPSLERRFFRMLRAQHRIPASNYFAWLAQALRFAPRGFAMMEHANKMYLRGLRHEYGSLASRSLFAQPNTSSRETVAHLAPPVLFFPAALDRMAWHAAQGHAIVLISGTLMPLAIAVAVVLQLRLLQRGLPAELFVVATQLGAGDGSWTGEVLGQPMFGSAKARALRQIANGKNWDLSRSYAYANAFHDIPMLEATGRPTAVNPSAELGSIAGKHGWPIFQWSRERRLNCELNTSPSMVEPDAALDARELICNESHRHNERACK